MVNVSATARKNLEHAGFSAEIVAEELGLEDGETLTVAAAKKYIDSMDIDWDEEEGKKIDEVVESPVTIDKKSSEILNAQKQFVALHSNAFEEIKDNLIFNCTDPREIIRYALVANFEDELKNGMVVIERYFLRYNKSDSGMKFFLDFKADGCEYETIELSIDPRRVRL